MFENFKRVVVSPDFTDSQAETFFWELAKDSRGRNQVTTDALNLLKDYRPELAKKIAREILQAAS